MVSWTLRHEVLDLYKTDPGKIHVIPNGVVKEQFDVSIDPGSIKAQCGLHYMTPSYHLCRQDGMQKGPDILVDASHLIRENTGMLRLSLPEAGYA